MKLRRSSAERAILGALRAGHHYGFPIINAARVQPGTAYAILAELERRGVVTSHWSDRAIGRRRCYHLTEGTST